VLPRAPPTNEAQYAQQQLDVLCDGVPDDDLVQAPFWALLDAPPRPSVAVDAPTVLTDRELQANTFAPSVWDLLLVGQGSHTVTSVADGGVLTVHPALPPTLEEDAQWTWVSTAGPEATLLRGSEAAVVGVLGAFRPERDRHCVVTDAAVAQGDLLIDPASGGVRWRVLACGQGLREGVAWHSTLPTSDRVWDLPVDGSDPPLPAGARVAVAGLSGVVLPDGGGGGTLRVQRDDRENALPLPADSLVVLARSDGQMAAGGSTDGERTTDAAGLLDGASRMPQTGVWWPVVPTAPPAGAPVVPAHASRVQCVLADGGAQLCCSAGPAWAGAVLVDQQGHHQLVTGVTARASAPLSGSLVLFWDDLGAPQVRRVRVEPGRFGAFRTEPFAYLDAADAEVPPGTRRRVFAQPRRTPLSVRVRVFEADGFKPPAPERELTVVLELFTL